MRLAVLPVVASLIPLMAGRTAEAASPGKNGKIAFGTDRHSEPFWLPQGDIYVINPDGTGETRLTFDSDSNLSAGGADWSPDGARIAFATDCTDPLFCPGYRRMYLMNADGSGRTFLVSGIAGAKWSPSGTQFAYTMYNKWDIYVMSANGTGHANLTNHPAADQSPAWSPDGSRLAFGSERDYWEVYSMNADGSGQTRLTNTPAFDINEQPDWSPDGSKIAFVSNRDGNGEIYVMNADGSGQMRLTNHPTRDSGPAWSPDGTKIAFTSNRDGNFEIYLMNPDGSGQTRVTNNPSGDGGPRWQPLPLTLSPGSGTVAATQGANLTVFLTKPGVTMTELTATLDGRDVSAQLSACLVPGSLFYGQTYRCPNVGGGTLGPGLHTLTVTLGLSDGSTVSDAVTYTVLDNTEGIEPGSTVGLSSGELPSLAISPESGLVAVTQEVDLTLILTAPPDLTPTGMTATLDGRDVSAGLSACLVAGSHASGQTFRCPNLGGSTVGVGLHKLTVTLTLSDGSSVTDTAFYTVLANTEP